MNSLPETTVLPLRTLARDGAASALLAEGRAFGPRGLLVHGRSLETGGQLAAILRDRPADLAIRPWCHPGGEPTLDQLEALLKVAREVAPDWVAGVGGGSVLDLAKAAAGLLHAQLPVTAYHNGAAINESRIPFVAVPTTAGTGSEATMVCVLTNASTGSKKSFRHPSFLARLVILDPRLLDECPPKVMAHSGMDALVQAIEAFISKGATAFSDALCLQALPLLYGALRPACSGQRGSATRDLLHGSFLAGLALSNARLGIVHGLAHPLGARYHAPHGQVCAVCLPAAIAFNREAMGAKYDRLSTIAGGDLLPAMQRLIGDLAIASPFAGRRLVDRDWIVNETLASGSTAANPRKVSAADVDTLLDSLFAA